MSTSRDVHDIDAREIYDKLVDDLVDIPMAKYKALFNEILPCRARSNHFEYKVGTLGH